MNLDDSTNSLFHFQSISSEKVKPLECPNYSWRDSLYSGKKAVDLTHSFSQKMFLLSQSNVFVHVPITISSWLKFEFMVHALWNVDHELLHNNKPFATIGSMSIYVCELLGRKFT